MSKQHPISERPIINQTVYYIRKGLHLSQEEAAEKMGMLHDTFSKKERYGNLTLTWATKFADCVGVDPSIFSCVFAENISNTYFKSDSWKRLLQSKIKPTIEVPIEPINPIFEPILEPKTYTVRYPDNIVDKIYSNQNEPKKSTPKSITLNVTEECLVSRFRIFSKEHREDVFDLVNSIYNNFYKK